MSPSPVLGQQGAGKGLGSQGRGANPAPLLPALRPGKVIPPGAPGLHVLDLLSGMVRGIQRGED